MMNSPVSYMDEMPMNSMERELRVRARMIQYIDYPYDPHEWSVEDEDIII